MNANTLEAYRRMHSDGRLSEHRWRVCELLIERGPMTRNEIDAALGLSPNASYSRRLTELEDLGLAVREGTKSCSITGFKCDLWRVVENPEEASPRRPIDRDAARRELLALAEFAETQGFELSENLEMFLSQVTGSRRK